MRFKNRIGGGNAAQRRKRARKITRAALAMFGVPHGRYAIRRYQERKKCLKK